MAVNVGTVEVTVVPNTSGLAAQLSAQVKPAADAVGRTLASRLSGASRGFSAFGRSATRYLTAPLALAGGASVKMAADFDQSMRNVNSILELSNDELANTSKAVLNLSTRVPQTAQVLSEGLYDIASSGFEGASGLTVLKAAAIAASAGMTDTAVASRATVSVLNAYGLQAKDATAVTDTLFQGVKVGVQTFEELAASIGNYIGVASQLKVPLNDVIGAQAAMTLTGLDAAQASISLNGIFKTLLKPSADLSKIFKEAGLASGEMAIEQLGLQGVMKLLGDEVGNNVSDWIKLFPEIRAARGAMALASDDGKLLDGVMQDMAASTGAAGRAFEEQSKGASFQFTIAMNKLRKAAIQLGNQLIPILLDTVIPAVEKAIKWFQDLSPASKELGLKLAGLALVAGPIARLGGALLGLGSGLAKFIPWLLRWPKGPFPVPTVPPGGGVPTPVPTGGRLPTVPTLPLPVAGLIAGAALGVPGHAQGVTREGPGVTEVDVAMLDNYVAHLKDIGRTGPVVASSIEQLNAMLEDNGSTLRVNNEVLQRAVREGISYTEAAGGIVDVSGEVTRATKKEARDFAAVAAGYRAMGLGAKEATFHQAQNLMKVGDYSGAIKLLERNLGPAIRRQNENLRATQANASAAEGADRAQKKLQGGFTSTASKASGATVKINDLTGAVKIVPDQATTRFQTPGLDSAVSGVKNLHDTISALPATKVINIKVNQTRGSLGAGEFGAYIPGAASGGFVNREQLLRVGERSKSEMILPLQDPAGIAALTKALKKAGGGGGNRVVFDGPVVLSVGGHAFEAYISGVARREDDDERRYRGQMDRRLHA